jgi:hypothetical protein
MHMSEMQPSEMSTDPSASTARFRAFTERADADGQAPWAMRAPATRVILFAAAIVVVAVVVGIIALSLAG